MNKEEIKHFKAMLRQGSLRHMNIILDDKFQKELLNIIKDYEKLQQENTQLKKQLEYLRSGEYLNQLKFERNLLEDIVQNSEVSKEDKEFIDMTHRNTELLEENQQLKSVIKEIREYIKTHISYEKTFDGIGEPYLGGYEIRDLLQILDKGEKNDFKGS